MTNPSETFYFEMLAAFRKTSEAHRAITLSYRNREIGDAAFLASRANVEAASRATDAAEALYLKSMQEPSAIERMIAHQVSSVEGRR